MSGDRQRGRQAYHGLLFASKQWGLQGISTTSGIEQLTLPLSSAILIGIVCDGGNGKGDVGFDSSAGLIYGNKSMGVAFLVLCRT